MPQVHVPASLRPFTDNRAVIPVDGRSVRAALRELYLQYPELENNLCDQAREVHSFFNLFVGENNIRDLQQLDTQVKEDQIILIVPALAGG